MIARGDCCAEIDKIVNTVMPRARRSELLRGRTGVPECAASALATAFAERDWRRFNRYTVVAADYPDNAYTPVLCAALDLQDDVVQPGDVLLTLHDIGDPACVPAVGRALFWKPEWDEFHDLAIKAFDLLLTIDNDEAWAIIKETVTDDRARIRELGVTFVSRRET